MTDRKEAAADFPNSPDAARPPAKKTFSFAAVGSFVCGWFALLLNLLVVTSPLGGLMGVTGIVLGAAGYRRHPLGKAGLAISLVSLLVLAVWIVSLVFPFFADPTFRFRS
jgi:phosphotransferase system  glucose/maltose/N-acetylglucosamine-specific IIC component